MNRHTRTNACRTLLHLAIVLLALCGLNPAFAEDSSSWSVREVNGSGVTGTVTLKDNGDGTTTVWIELQGNGTWAGRAVLREGTFERHSTEDAYRLEDVVDGASKTVLQVPLQELLATDKVLLLSDPNVPGAIQAYGALNSI